MELTESVARALWRMRIDARLTEVANDYMVQYRVRI
jgi:hypothetical protein